MMSLFSLITLFPVPLHSLCFLYFLGPRELCVVDALSAHALPVPRLSLSSLFYSLDSEAYSRDSNRFSRVPRPCELLFAGPRS